MKTAQLTAAHMRAAATPDDLAAAPARATRPW
jgi:hypothetical protein